MLCSRAITREEAAMSGSIAAFVFIGALRSGSPYALYNFEWNFGIGIDLP